MKATKLWDAIVIGSGIGGLGCAAALSKFGHQVLVLEQSASAGGLTHSFSRDGWRWDVGVHYLGDVGHDGHTKKLLDWLAGSEVKMAPMGPVYDTLHFPDHFEMAVSRPEEALKMDLREKFPRHVKEIDVYFQAVNDAANAMRHMFSLRGMPAPVANLYHFLHGRAIDKWCSRTTQQVLNELITDVRLRSVLSAQWGDYGGLPKESSFGIHAMVTQHYFSGAFYPEGGASALTERLHKTVESADGRVETNTRVSSLLMEGDHVIGVKTIGGKIHHAKAVISDIGAHNTVSGLLPSSLQSSDWAREILSFGASPGSLSLYIGFEGDIAAHGAGKSNHWVYNNWGTNTAIWRDPVEDPLPMFFLSFPSLKDPRHDPGSDHKHTANMLAFTHWDIFARWGGDPDSTQSASYLQTKLLLEKKMLAALEEHFPALMPFVKYQELATPITTQNLTGAHQGGAYGIEVTPRRFLSSAFNAKTPVPGLYLSGQDAGTPGIAGALWGAMIAAGSIEPKVFLKR